MFERNGQKLGSVLVDEVGTEPEPDEQQDDALPEPEEREDGVHSVGGGWHEVVVDGEVVDKVRGSEAAEEAYETYREVSDGDD